MRIAGSSLLATKRVALAAEFLQTDGLEAFVGLSAGSGTLDPAKVKTQRWQGFLDQTVVRMA